jgi:hypothetical protein
MILNLTLPLVREPTRSPINFLSIPNEAKEEESSRLLLPLDTFVTSYRGVGVGFADGAKAITIPTSSDTGLPPEFI